MRIISVEPSATFFTYEQTHRDRPIAFYDPSFVLSWKNPSSIPSRRPAAALDARSRRKCRGEKTAPRLRRPRRCHLSLFKFDETPERYVQTRWLVFSGQTFVYVTELARSWNLKILDTAMYHFVISSHCGTRTPREENTRVQRNLPVLSVVIFHQRIFTR